MLSPYLKLVTSDTILVLLIVLS